MEGKRTDTPTMVSPKRAQAVRSHPLKTLMGAVTPTGWAVVTLVVVGPRACGRLPVGRGPGVRSRGRRGPAARSDARRVASPARRVDPRPQRAHRGRPDRRRRDFGAQRAGPFRALGHHRAADRHGDGRVRRAPAGCSRDLGRDVPDFLASPRHHQRRPRARVRSDALGLLRRVRMWDEPVLLHVHPRTVRVPFDATGFQLDVAGRVHGQALQLRRSPSTRCAITSRATTAAPCTGSRRRAWASSSCASTRRRTAPTTSSSWIRRATRGTTTPLRLRSPSPAPWAWRTCANRARCR